MLPDIKFALRQMAKRPGPTIVAVLILGLGIASNTTVFSLINTLLLRGLPVSHPEELVLVLSRRGPVTSSGFSYPAYERFSRHSQALSGVLAFDQLGRSLIVPDGGQENIVSVHVASVSGNYFSCLGVAAFLGRTLVPDDDRPNAPRAVAVVSHEFWRRQFGSDPGVLGKTVRIDNVQMAIVGVAAPKFSGLEVGTLEDVWVPLQLDPLLTPSFRDRFQGPTAAQIGWLSVMGRVPHGTRLGAAQVELDVQFHRVLEDTGISAKGRADLNIGTIDLKPGGSGFIDQNDMGSLLAILMAVVGLVLVIACANVASLLLARAAARQHEFALRIAIGAGRRQLIRQLMTESLCLAAAAGATGLILSHWGTQLVAGYLDGGQNFDLSPDGRVLAFTLGVSVTTGVLIGLLPALRFSSLNVVSSLKAQGISVAGGSANRLNRTLVSAQIALSVCLLAGAGLFVRTLENLRNVDVGFRHQNVLWVYFPFDKSDTPNRRISLSRDIQAALVSLPGVRQATYSWGGGGLLSGGGSRRGVSFSVPGYVPAPTEAPARASITYVGPGFLTTLGIPLLRGRDIELADLFPASGQLVDRIVVNEALVRRFFGSTDPIGRLITIPDDRTAAVLKINRASYRISGVAGNTKVGSMRDDDMPEIYMPGTGMATQPTAYFKVPNGVFLQIRTDGDPLGMVASIRSTIQSLYPKMRSPLFGTMDDAIDQSISQEKVIAHTAGGFSLFALLLASLGLYGVLAYNVVRRTREIGVRMALGARPSSIISLILGQGLLLTAIGCAAGMIAAMAIGHAIAARLYGISALDPLTFLFTAAVLLLVALVACWLPARRATKVDPMIALRSE